MASDTKKCAMEGCLCNVREGEKFCSAYCQTAKKEIKLECDCGHPACESQKL